MFKIGDKVIFIHDWEHDCPNDDCIYLYMSKGTVETVEDIDEDTEALLFEEHSCWYTWVFDSVEVLNELHAHF